MKEETKFMKKLLPSHYTCESRDNGVHCYSKIGIEENDSGYWEYILFAIKQEFKERFSEIFHQTCANHTKFTVFLKKINHKIINDLCQCGHKRKYHLKSHSINYTDGICTKCNCEHFIINQ